MKLSNRTMLWLVLGLAAVVMAGAAYAAPQSGAGPAGKRTIHLREASPTPKLTVVDTGAPGLSVGDRVVTTDGVVDEHGAAAGSLEQVCTVIATGPSLFASTFDCTGSFDLAGGTVTIQGPFVPADELSSQAVSGGTGAFARSRGEVVLATEADTIAIELS